QLSGLIPESVSALTGIRRMVAAADCTNAGDQPGDGGAIPGVFKTSHCAHRDFGYFPTSARRENGAFKPMRTLQGVD
ncbi:MAG: hypothetical protein QME60_09530, partial [Verrucomicrobiota bacterium]|nr:hypothetical protein [Verrucomicrobiota bacterium]